MQNFREMLEDNPVIGAIRCDKDLNLICKSNAKIVFVLYGNILDIKNICNTLNENNKIIFIHLDMLEGLKSDQKAVEFIKESINPYGIISTKGIILKHASQLGMATIQRIFMLDSLSFETSIKNIHMFSPDAVEVLPGVANKAISSLQKKITQPIIAGGLIKNKKDAIEALSSGAVAVSTSSLELWEIK
ncbi:glycerol uptake operon antiterminator [Clostridium sp. USBA 49]|uniref:glycerol-3-phosphate responsive antiterminator n=1 Tax=Clostridium prolinivorans TaxID=2769420 RepID=UPI0009C686D6|nr:glycerol uptake operon antiterminator [Clostridium sp. USBA 49]